MEGKGSRSRVGLGGGAGGWITIPAYKGATETWGREKEIKRERGGATSESKKKKNTLYL